MSDERTPAQKVLDQMYGDDGETPTLTKVYDEVDEHFGEDQDKVEEWLQSPSPDHTTWGEYILTHENDEGLLATVKEEFAASQA